MEYLSHISVERIPLLKYLSSLFRLENYPSFVGSPVYDRTGRVGASLGDEGLLDVKIILDSIMTRWRDTFD